MPTPIEIRNIAGRVRNSKQNIDSAKRRFQSCADAAPVWWKGEPADTFKAGKNSTLNYSNNVVSEMNTLDNKLLYLAEAVKRADDEKRAAKK